MRLNQKKQNENHIGKNSKGKLIGSLLIIIISFGLNEIKCTRNENNSTSIMVSEFVMKLMDTTNNVADLRRQYFYNKKLDCQTSILYDSMLVVFRRELQGKECKIVGYLEAEKNISSIKKTDLDKSKTCVISVVENKQLYYILTKEDQILSFILVTKVGTISNWI